MPTYVYGCDACGYRFEKLQKFSDEPIRVCPSCQNTVRRILQPAGIVFKGSGWHTTDYKRNSGGDSGNGGGDSGNGGEAKTDAGKSEAKTDAAKSETKTSDTTSTSNAATDTAKPAQAA
jgi:putative FmdB family regulatory protein